MCTWFSPHDVAAKLGDTNISSQLTRKSNHGYQLKIHVFHRQAPHMINTPETPLSRQWPSYWPSYPTLLSSWNANMSWISKDSQYFVFFLCSKCSEKYLNWCADVIMCALLFRVKPAEVSYVQPTTGTRTVMLQLCRRCSFKMCIFSTVPQNKGHVIQWALWQQSGIWIELNCTIFVFHHGEHFLLGRQYIGEVTPLSVDHHGILEKYVQLWMARDKQLAYLISIELLHEWHIWWLSIWKEHSSTRSHSS